MISNISLPPVSLAILAIALFVPLAADADKLGDFKSAAKSAESRQGCDAIPYGSERGSCKGLNAQVDKYCKMESHSCKSFGTKSLIEQTENLKKAIEADTRKGEKQKAEEKQKKLDELQKKLDHDKKEIQKRLEMATGCFTSRKSVQTLFANVKSKIKGESDKALESYVDELNSYYESEEKNHDKAMKDAERAVELCKQSKAGSR